MKKLTRSLFAAFLMIGVAVLTLTGATYAWFQGGSEADMTEFDANVMESDGLLMSWNPTLGYKSLLSLQDAEYLATSTNTQLYVQGENGIVPNNNFVLAPVSTAGDVTAGEIKFFTAELKSDGLTIVTSEAATGTYIKFDLYFFVTEAQDIYITESIFGTKTTGQSAVNLASRMAVVNNGFTSYTASDGAAKALELKDGLASFIYEPNATTHTSAGQIDKPADADAAGKYDYYGIAKAGYTGTRKPAEALGGGELVLVETVTTAAEMKISLGAGHNKVTFYVWVEGQDADCTNDVADTNVSVNLKFAKTVPSA